MEWKGREVVCFFCDQGLERGRYQVRDPAEVEQGLATAGEHANALRAVARGKGLAGKGLEGKSMEEA